jgi:Glyoxalase-like domain
VTAFILNITFECRDPSAMGQFWSAVTGYPVDPEASADRVRLTHPDGRGVRHLLFLGVAVPRNDTRIHIDLAAQEPATEIERLVAIGATLEDPRDENGAPTWRGGEDKRWVVLRDIEGNEFCLG